MSKLIRLCLGAVAAICVFIAFVQLISYSSNKCVFINGSISIQCTEYFKNHNNYDDLMLGFCPKPAIEGYGYIPSIGAQMELLCPWSTGTSLLTYLSVIPSLAFFGMFVFSRKAKRINCQVGAVSSACNLLISLLMYSDISSGYELLATEPPEEGETYTQKGFVGSLVCVIFILSMTIIGTIQEYKNMKGLSFIKELNREKIFVSLQDLKAMGINEEQKNSTLFTDIKSDVEVLSA